MTTNTFTLTTITLGEFRSWLQGVEDMQAENWHPTLEQWNKIRTKIDSIEQDVDHVQETYTVGPTVMSPSMPYIPQPMYNPPPFISSTIAPQYSTSPKTPDIDTSSGQYTPPFL